MKANTIMDSTENNYYINSGKQSIANGGDANMMMEELTKLIRGLEKGIKVPFLMHYEGFKYQEIADHLNLPLGTVKSRIFFARKELKAKVEVLYQGASRFKQ